MADSMPRHCPGLKCLTPHMKVVPGMGEHDPGAVRGIASWRQLVGRMMNTKSRCVVQQVVEGCLGTGSLRRVIDVAVHGPKYETRASNLCRPKSYNTKVVQEAAEGWRESPHLRTPIEPFFSLREDCLADLWESEDSSSVSLLADSQDLGRLCSTRPVILE
jgi:hypothetical protein